MKLLALLAASAAAQVHFTDVTQSSGIRFVHNAGKQGRKYLPETMGSGLAWIDADADTWPDLLFLNAKGRPALYRNTRNGAFTDVTPASGLASQDNCMGVAVADYDNDGREDLYITCLDGDRLYHNEGNFKFKDVTQSAGIRNVSFGTSAAWLDYDRDGKLDLFVANYVQWTREKDLWCSLDGATKSYCTPESYKGTSSKLFRNLGSGKFEDVSQKSAIADPTSKSLGITILDYNNDGWPDIFVANDTQPNKLYRNLRNGSFKEEGLAAGVAFGEDGVARGAMGVDAADYDRSGRQHLLIGNFSNQMLGLYHNEGNGLFVDEAPRSSVGRASLLSLAFGVFFFDYDLDGYPDIFAANGHIEEEINRVQPKVTFKELPLLFRNLGKGKFEEAAKQSGLATPIVARGAAYADYDKDGDLDIAISTNNGPAILYRNDGGNKNNWLQVSLKNGIGATVRIGSQWQTLRSGSSYCSASQLLLTFGLGKEPAVPLLEVEWPNGKRTRMTNLPVNKLITVAP